MDRADYLGQPVRSLVAALYLALALIVSGLVILYAAGTIRIEIGKTDGPVLTTEKSLSPAENVPSETTTLADPAEDTDPTTVGGTPRRVGGAGITPAPSYSEPLEREPVAPPPSHGPEPARWTVFPRVVVLEAGTLDTGKRNIVLAGITFPDPAENCRRTPSAEEKSCILLGRQVLRQRVRALGVECQLAPDNRDDPAIAPCRIGNTDLALWLVDQGWARASRNAPDAYQAAETAARCAKLGLWLESPPPGNCPGG